MSRERETGREAEARVQTARTAALPPFSQTGRQRRPPPAAFAHTGSGPASPVWRKKSGSLVRWRWRVARQRAAAHLSIALGILEQVEQEFDRLRRPAALGGRRARRVLRLRMPADAAVEEAERHRLLLLQHVLEVALRLLERHRADSGGGDAGVLEVDAQVAAARLARLGRVLRLARILDHGWQTTRLAAHKATTSAKPTYPRRARWTHPW